MADLGLRITAVDQASAVIQKVAAEAANLSKTVNTTASSFKTLAAVGGSLSIGVLAAGLASSVKQSIDLADSFNKLSQKSGVAVESLSALNYAAGLSDVSTEALGTSLKKLNINISAAANGSKEEAALFKALGVSVKDASGNVLSADKVFAQIATRFSESADNANKTAVAVALLGKNGSDVIPLLNAGAKGLADYGDEARKMGLIIGPQFARNAEEFNDNLHKLQVSGQGLGIALGGELVKGLGDVTRAMTDAVIEGGKLHAVWVGLGALGAAIFTNEFSSAAVKIKDLNKEIADLEQSKAFAKTLGGRLLSNLLGTPEEFQQRIDRANADLKALQEVLNGTAKPKKREIFGPDAALAGKDPVEEAAKALAQKNAAASAYAAINKTLQQRLALNNKELELGRQLTESEKFAISVLESLDAAKGKIGATEKKRLLTLLDTVKATDLQRELQERTSKADFAAAEAQIKYVASLGEGLEKLRADNIAQEESNARIGLGVQAIAELDAAKLEDQALTLEGIAIKKLDRNGDEAGYNLLKAQAAELRRLGALKKSGALKEQEFQIAREIEAEWQRTAESINQSLTDALLRGFESGKGFAENFRDTVANMFKTLVLRPIISAAVNPLAQGITGALGFSSAANAAGSSFAGSAAGSAAGLSVLGSAFGSSLSAGFSATVSSFGAATGVAIEGGLASIATGTSTAIASGLGQIAGALGPYAAALAALVAISKATSGETRAGGQYGYSFDGTSALNARRGLSVSASGIGAAFLEGPSGGDPYAKEASAAINATVTAINTTLAAVGSKATLTAFQAGYESSGAGRGGVFAGGTLSTGARFGESGQGDNYAGTLFERTSTQSPDAKQAIEGFALDLQQATIQALQTAVDVPKIVQALVSGVDAESLTAEAAKSILDQVDQVATQIKGFQAAVQVLPFEKLKTLSIDAAAGLIQLAGGLDKLGSGLSTYYDNFYSTAEKQSRTITNITATLNAAGATLTDSDVAGATRETFRQIVESIDVTTEAGQKLYVAAISVAGAFAEVHPELVKTKTVVDDLTDSVRANADAWQAEGQRLQSLYETRQSWQKRLDALTSGLSSEQISLQNDLAGVTDAATQALIRQVHAQEGISQVRDEATAAYIAAQQQVADAQQQVANALHSTIKSFQDFLSTLDSTARPTDQLAGARERFNSLSTRAGQGDTAALQEITSAGKAYLDLSKGYSASVVDYRRDQANVRNTINRLIDGGQQLLNKLPEDLRAASDPVKDAYAALTRATTAEAEAKTLALAIGADLATSEKGLAERYLQLIKDVPDGDALLAAFEKQMIVSVPNMGDAFNFAALAERILRESAPTLGQAPGFPAQPAAQVSVGGVALTGANGAYNTSITPDGLVRSDGPAGTQIAYARDVAALLNDFADANGVPAALARAAELGFSDAQIGRLRTFSQGVPKFVSGGYHSGGWRLVGEDGPELENTGPSRIFSASQTLDMMRYSDPQANSAALANEIRRLNERIASLENSLSLTSVISERHARTTADGIDRLVQLHTEWTDTGLKTTP